MVKIFSILFSFLFSVNFFGLDMQGLLREPAFVDLFEEKREEFILNKESFLEVNLDKMKVYFYREGELDNEFNIITKGDPDHWGGSAVGLYKILSGHKSSFSVSSDVYMPYALNYYGKYYIHGKPYYWSGNELDSSVSGGCIRLENEDAESVYDLTELNMPVLVIDKERDNYNYSEKELLRLPFLSAEGYLVADLDSGFIFLEKNSKDQFPIASLTKLMTAVVVAENVNLRRTVLVNEGMLEAYGITEELEAGERFRVVELFYPLLIESSNDAAEALTGFLGRDRTIELMNQKAKSVLMENTIFVCPSGFDCNNVSTARDLFYLGRYVLNNRPPLLEITKGKRVRSFGDVSFEVEELWNKNIFIEDPTFLGGKTGYIEESKGTALFIFQLTTEQGVKRNIAIVLLGSLNVKLDTQRAYLWLLDNYF